MVWRNLRWQLTGIENSLLFGNESMGPIPISGSWEKSSVLKLVPAFGRGYIYIIYIYINMLVPSRVA